MADDKPIILKPKRKKKLRKVVERQKAEYRGFFKTKTPSGKKDADGNPLWVYVLSWTDEHGNRKQKREHCKDDAEAKAKRNAFTTRVEEIKEKGIVVTPVADSFADEAVKYLRHQKKHVTAAEYERQRGIVEGHLVPFFGKMVMANIRRADVIAYITERKEAVSDGSILKERNVLRRMFNRGIEDERLFANPAAGPALKKIVPKKPEGRKGWVKEKNDFDRILAACYIQPTKSNLEPVQWLQQIAKLAFFIGARRGELMATTPQDFDFNESTVTFRKTKNGRERTMPLNWLALEVLVQMGVPERKRRGDRKTLWTADVTPEQVSMKFIRACRSAGFENISLHSMRHSFSSWLSKTGSDQQDVQDGLGHLTPGQSETYNHRQIERLRQATQRFADAFGLPQPVTIEGEVKALPADTTS